MANGYLLGKELGTGGMGRVFAATRTWDGLKVALKLLHPRLSRDPVGRRSIATEALATAALEHDNVTRVLDLDEHPTHGMFLVSELVAGRSLRQLLDAQLPLARGLAILRDVLEGLRAAHAAGVVHGDLKPANVLVDDLGHVKVCDFGIAQIMAPTARGASRREAVGTPRYMAPEQFMPGLTLDPRTDLYAFGVMLFEMLYGAPPFPAGVLDTMKAKAKPPPPAATDASGEPVPFALRALAASAIHPDIRRRPRFAAEALACIDAALASLGPDGPPSWSPRARGVTGARTAIEEAAEALGTVLDLAAAASPSVEDEPSDAALAGAVAMMASPASESAPMLSAAATEMLATRFFAKSGAVAPGDADASSPSPSPSQSPSPSPSPLQPQPPATKTVAVAFESAFLSTSHTPGTALVHMRPPPLVGRESEQALLVQEAQRVVATRTSRVVLLTGASGVGKSRLAGWLCSHLEVEGSMEAVSARFSSHAGPSACGLRGMVSALYAPSTSQVARAVRSSVAWIGRSAPRGRSDAGAGAAGSDAALDEEVLALWLRSSSESDAADPHGTASLALEALGAYAAARPICLWFDDLASAEDGSIELVARLAESQPGRPMAIPILVVATVTDEALADPGTRARLAPILEPALQVPLGPLDLDARMRLLEGMLPFALGVAERLAPRLGGHPLFIVQQVEQWVEARALVHSDAGLDLGGSELSGSELDRARDTDALIDARVEAHLARTREAVPVLYLLALLGPYGDGSALVRACEARGIDAAVVDLVLEEGLCRGILRARADEIAFAHASLRAATLARARADADYPRHAAAAADAIAATAAVERPSARAYVAVLLRDAGERERAFDTIIEAAETMARGGDHARADRAIDLVRRWAREASPFDPERRRDEIDFVDARSAYFQLDWPRARRVLDALLPRIREAVARGDERGGLLARTLGLSGHAYFFQDDPEQAEQAVAALREAVPLARDPHSVIGCVIAHLESSIAALRGDEEAAFEAFHRSIDTADPWMRWSVRGKLAEIEAARGRHPRAQEFLRRARTECGTLDVYQVRYLRESDAKLALCRREPRDRRVYEELVRAQGDAWSRTAARLALAAWDATFAPASMDASAGAALDAFALVAHDELISHLFLRTVRDALAARGRIEQAARATALLEARRAVADGVAPIVPPPVAPPA